jgi:putative flippase GtrA
MLQHRLARLGIVGIAATLVHATTLTLLKTLFQLGTGPANLLGFVVSFSVSMYGQTTLHLQRSDPRKNTQWIWTIHPFSN